MLIPKIKELVTISDYRPISLCNALYKITIKTLANRLKHVLEGIISHNQSALIIRLISNNIVLAYEALNSMNTRKTKRVSSMTIKLDMLKVYNRV